jgi:hypothetical protein
VFLSIFAVWFSGFRVLDVDVFDCILVVRQLVAVRMVRVHAANDPQPESNRFSFDRLSLTCVV